MNDRRSHSHAQCPPCPGSGRTGASGPERPGRSCSCPPPGPTPHHWAHDRQPTTPGSAPTSPPPPSPRPTETDHSPVAGRVPPPTHHRLSALGRSCSTPADPSPSRLGPPRLPLAGCPSSRLGRGSGHPRTKSRRQPSPDHPHSRRALDHRDDARAIPPRAAAQPAANPPPTSASTPTQAQPPPSPPTTPRYREERPATPRPAPDDPPHEPSSANLASLGESFSAYIRRRHLEEAATALTASNHVSPCSRPPRAGTSPTAANSSAPSRSNTEQFARRPT